MSSFGVSGRIGLPGRVIGAWATLVWGWLAWGQGNLPRIGYAYPAGGQRGTTFQVQLGGQFLDGVTNVVVSGAGVEAKVVEYYKPLTVQQFNNLREKLKELQDKRAAARQGGGGTNVVWTAADEKQLAEIRKKVAMPPNRMASPAIAERVRVEVRLAPDAKAGRREVRLGTGVGLTNPLAFEVGDLAEVGEKGAENEAVGARLGRNGGQQGARAPRPTMDVRLPATVNGQILPGEVDRYRLAARRGQQLVAVVQARDLIPYLPDAVPGWFQATLALYDGKGTEIAYDDDYRFDPDPVLHCEIPRDGEYVLELKDAIYRGREDFVYRMTVGELPYVTSVFPLGSAVGKPAMVEVLGWNLGRTNVVWDRPELRSGVHGLRVEANGRESNEVPFALNTLPEAVEQEGNDTQGQAGSWVAPVIVNGRIGRAGDCDVFRFEGRSGQRWVAEVQARRLGSPLDSVVRVLDAGGRVLGQNDDVEDKGAGLDTHHADSRVEWTAAADGAFFVEVKDAQGKGGVEYGYRLRVSPPRPDFDLRLVPSSVAVRGGGTVPLAVHVLRRDGYGGEILLALVGAPPEMKLAGGRVPAGVDKVRVTLTVPPGQAGLTMGVEMEGRAVIGGEIVSHRVVPAEDMMQAFAYRHLVPVQEFEVRWTESGRRRTELRVLGGTPVRLPVDGTARVQLSAPPRAATGRFQIELSEPPEGVAIDRSAPNREGVEVVLRVDGKKAQAGLKGNLIMQVFASGGGDSGGRPQANRRRTPVDTLPAIPFEVVAGAE